MNCCVPFCKSSRNLTRKYDPVVYEINFHNFPADAVLREKWIKAITGGDPQTSFTFGRWDYVCSLHFKHENFVSYKTHKHLAPGSVPSIFPQHPQSSGQKENSNVAHQNIEESGSAEISVADNAVIPETENQNCSVPATTIGVNNGNQTTVNVNPSTNVIGNRNLSYVGEVEISDSDKKLKNYKIFQCTVKPPEANDTSVYKPINYVDTHAKSHPRASGDRFSRKPGKKRVDRNKSLDSIRDIFNSVFSNTENHNISPQNNTTSADDTVNSETSIYDNLNLDNCSNVSSESNNSDGCEDSNNEDNDSDCTTYLNNNNNSSLNVNDNSISTLSADQRMTGIQNWRAVTYKRIHEHTYSNRRLRRQISKLKKTIEKCQLKNKTRDEFLNRFNIEAMEKGIENKDAKSLFLQDQLKSLTKDRILWSESSLDFMRRLVKKFPESYEFLKQADVMYLPNPRVLGCKKIKKC